MFSLAETDYHAMCRLPDSRPMRLVKKWLRGGTSTKPAAVRSRQQQPMTVSDVRGGRASGVYRWRDEPPSTVQRQRGNPSFSSSSSSSGCCLLCPAAGSMFCWRRRRVRTEPDESQQTLALVYRRPPLRAVQPLIDDEV